MRPIRVFEVIGQRRRLFFGLLCVLIIFSSSILSWNLYRNTKPVRAVPVEKVMTNGEIIKQTDTSDYSNYNIIIPSGVTATIDGEHAFNNLTVKNGGVLTSSDFNNYGIYNSGNPADETFENLIGSGSAEYVFITRGLINVGGDPATWTFSACNGAPTNWTTPSQPTNMAVDNVASVEFFAPIATPVDPATMEYPASYFSGSAVGHAHSSTSGLHSAFVDNITDVNHIYLPFEYRFTNTGGNAQFGLCHAKNVPTSDPANNYYLETVDLTTDFNDSATAPQMKTLIGWQGASTNIYSGNVSDYDAYTSYISGLKFSDSYNPEYFFQSSIYDFANDKKVSLNQSTEMLNSERTFTNRTEQNELDNYRKKKAGVRNDYSAFYPTSGWYSPLASRRGRYQFRTGTSSWETIQYFQPILSFSLVNSMPIKAKTEITLSGGLTVENNGKINFTGKGFAYYSILGLGSGSGPAGVSRSGSGASHSGAGGAACGSPAGGAACGSPAVATYDTILTLPPKLPGSSSSIGGDYTFHSYSAALRNSHYGNGGGFIKIVAENIKIASGAMVLANAVGGNVGQPAPGASGGGVVLFDSNSASTYDGLFSAQGGSCRESGSAWFGAWNCYGGGGGGGYIYVSTFADSGTLKARIDKIHLAPVFASPDLIYNPNSAYFFDSSIAQNAFIATGGDSESGANGRHGIVNIITTVEKSYRIAKILEPVDRPSLTARAEFNPYGLLLGDTIRVKINVSNLIPDTKVEDEILRANIGGREVECKNPRDFSPAGGAFDGVNKIYWNYIGTATSADFTYLCTIN